MPKYYPPPENLENRGKIKITWYPTWRNWPIIGGIIPYHVGDRVKFSIHTERPNPPSVIFLHHVVYEEFSGEPIRAYLFDGSDTEIPTRRISHTVDVEYSIGLENKKWKAESILSATVESWDTVRNKWFLLILAAILGGIISLAVGILLGFIQINPAIIATW